ncbi:MAG: hypothetical protein HQL55_19050, partial [Magnetococcales bacterium]|nr:hypothetical protein [Magnetococcales bacterium]
MTFHADNRASPDQPSSTQEAFFQGLLPFLLTLQGHGFTVGGREMVEVHRLLVLWGTHQPLPQSQELAQLLAPLLCHTPQQQQTFYDLFQKWQATGKTLSAPPSLPPMGEIVRPTPPLQTAPATVKADRSLAARVAIFIVTLFLAVVALGYFLSTSAPIQEPTKQEPPPLPR